MIKPLVKVIALIFIAVLFTSYFMPLLKGVTALLFGAVSLLFVGTLIYAGVTISRIPVLNQDPEFGKWWIEDPHRGFVVVFLSQPSPDEFLNLSSPEVLDSLILSGNAFQSFGKTEVEILERSDDPVVKVRMLQGVGKGKDGFVLVEFLKNQ